MENSLQPIQPTGTFEGLKPGAILIGAVVDHIATFLVSFPLTLVYLGGDVFSQNDEEAVEAAIDALASDTGYLLWLLGLGLGCTVLGAYVGASRAGQLHLRHGGWVSVTSAAIGIVLMLAVGVRPTSESPLWYEVAGWALLIPAGLLGGELSRRFHAHP
jgi:hypothetical protein